MGEKIRKTVLVVTAGHSVKGGIDLGVVPNSIGRTHRANPATSRGVNALLKKQWRFAAILMLVSVTCILLLFRDTALSMGATWYRSGTFSHGFVVLPTTPYLIWARRHRVAAMTPGPNHRGILLLAASALGWLLGDLADVLVVKQLALVAMLPGLVLTTLGTNVTRALLFPLTFLIFAVPMGESLVPRLQDFTAFFTVKALELSRVPVLLEGRILSVPSGTWEVAEACSGIRYLISSLALGTLYASVVCQSWTRRLAFVLASVVVPIFANGIRAYGIVMLGHLSNNRIAVGVDHVIYGWLFFLVVVLSLFVLGWRWRGHADRITGDMERPSQPAPAPSATAMTITVGQASSLKALIVTAVSGIAVVAIAPVAAHVLANPPRAPVVIRATPPLPRAPWQPLATYRANWQPRFLGADAEVTQSYSSGAQEVHLYLAYYATQRQGKELIHSANMLVDGKHWVWLREEHRRATVDGQYLTVSETLLRSRKTNRLVWSWYWVAGEFTASPYRAKFLQAKAKLLRRPSSAAIIALGADYRVSPAEAAETLQEFLQHTSLLSALNGFSR